MGYDVDLEVFSGPFDLLLQLIARRRVDVTEIDLADITGDYLASLQGIDRLDLEAATGFLVIAATLVELKAARLLPSEDREDEHDLLAQARDVLYLRLLEYRGFRAVSRSLAARLDEQGGHRARQVELDQRFRRLLPEARLAVSPDEFGRLASRALQPRTVAEVGLDHIRRTFMSLKEAADLVLQQVVEVGATATFAQVVAGRRRTDAVVVFLAALELYKLGQVELDQADHRGPLSISRRRVRADLGVLVDLEVMMTAAHETGDGDDDGRAGDRIDAKPTVADDAWEPVEVAS